MELLTIANKIEEKIKLLEKMRIEIKDRAENKANTIAEYDKQLAITIIKLKNNNIQEWDGEKIENLQATLIEKMARGICWQAKLNMEKAEALYKSLISNIDSVCAEMNGWQSVNRYLEKK
jgi:hypothetical protein